MPTTENFRFDRTTFGIFTCAFRTDGTTGFQTMRSVGAMQVANTTGLKTMFAEPETNAAIDAGRSLDHFSRIIAICSRSAGTGTWEIDARFRRAGSATDEFSIPDFACPVYGSDEDGIHVWDGILPPDFMKSRGGSENILDTVQLRVRVNAGSADAADVACTILLVPGFVAGESNKGANLSAPQFLTHR